MTTLSPACSFPLTEMVRAEGTRPRAGTFSPVAERRHFLRIGPLVALASLLALLLTGCADIGLDTGSCLVNGEKFTHVTDATVEFRTHSIPQRVLDTYTKEELKVYRSPRSSPDLMGGEFYQCVVKKADWQEAMPAKLTQWAVSDAMTAITPRGQTVEFTSYDIDHWVLNPWRSLFATAVWE